MKGTFTSIFKAEDKAALEKYGTGYRGNGGVSFIFDTLLCFYNNLIFNSEHSVTTTQTVLFLTSLRKNIMFTSTNGGLIIIIIIIIIIMKFNICLSQGILF